MSDGKITKLTIGDSSYQIDLPIDADVDISQANITDTAITKSLNVSSINITNDITGEANNIAFTIGSKKFRQTIDNVARAKYADKVTYDGRGDKISDTYTRNNVIAGLKTLGGIKIETIPHSSYDKYTVDGLNIGLNNAIICLRWGALTGPTSELDTSCKINFKNKEVMRAYAANKTTQDFCDEDNISVKLTCVENSASSTGFILPACIYPVKTKLGTTERSYAYGFGVLTTSDSTASLDYKINYLLIGSKILS